MNKSSSLTSRKVLFDIPWKEELKISKKRPQTTGIHCQKLHYPISFVLNKTECCFCSLKIWTFLTRRHIPRKINSGQYMCLFYCCPYPHTIILPKVLSQSRHLQIDLLTQDKKIWSETPNLLNEHVWFAWRGKWR